MALLMYHEHWWIADGCMHDPHVITQLLDEIGEGQVDARESLIRLLYDQLHDLAHAQIRRSGPQATLSTTVLVNEAYLKLFRQPSQNFRNRQHFFGCAALAMRQLLIDYARRRLTGKRSPEVPMPTLEPQSADTRAVDQEELLALDTALTELHELDDRLSQLVELRFFAGLSVEDIAELRDCSARTVVRDWRKARAFLAARMVA